MSSGVVYSNNGRSFPQENKENIPPQRGAERPQQQNYHYLPKIDIIRHITQRHKITMKYSYMRPKAELIQILEQLDAGVAPEMIEQMSS